ncbi:ATP-dependent DNA helicase RecQ [Aquincola sp. J276]|uniref:RecQ family ATP-dependent DNA helicase n=1 Tax=Aquincola sp. J276 TaxID=2898432 RepID=UPI00215103D1|nr:RecQ family ATP-dependent DNA helicase [Aquincola sp. J276]MCR5868697.1 RecQ family ATP-dependent DNA helicase [Aquincola sp. J276]
MSAAARQIRRRTPAREGLPPRALQALRQVFGLRALRPGQGEVVARVMRGDSTLAVMPTGAGKSLCYQLPALLSEQRTLVVSPLIALMKDQCDGLRDLGIDAVAWHSGLNAEALAATEAAVADGSARIVFTTPERAAEPGFADVVNTGRAVGLLVIDEAHCISQWGHAFRPAYLELAPLRGALGKPPVLALTATATEQVAEEVMAQLGIPAGGLLRAGVYRPNLHYRVEPQADEEDKRERAVALVQATEGTGIVYAATVREAEAVHALLQEAANAAGQPPQSIGLYHGRMNAADRNRVQDAFIAGEVRVMVATPAFGLGIDKPDIRFIVHLQLPPGLDAYYQETGRAGRDGEDADCTLLYLRGDRGVQQFFMAGRYPDREAVSAVLRQVSQAGEPAELEAVAEAADLPAARVRGILNLLAGERLVRRDGQGRWRAAPGRRLDDAALARVLQACEQRREQDKAELEAMVFYAQTGTCRWQVLLRHFEPEAGHPACGHCDSCRRLQAFEALREAEAAQQAAADAGAQPIQVLAAGTAVRVKRYGLGEVVSGDASSLTIRFPGGAERSFHPDFVRPARQRRAVAAA